MELQHDIQHTYQGPTYKGYYYDMI
jgi:hypothetical protein